MRPIPGRGQEGHAFMEPEAILEALLGLAKEAGLEVRMMQSGPLGDLERPPQSGVCRLRDRHWVVLFAEDPPLALVEVLAGALKTHHIDHVDAICTCQPLKHSA